MTVVYERRDAVGYLTLDRPSVLNALSRALVGDLRAALARAAADAGARVLVLRGAGRAFCAGADLAESDDGPEEWRRRLADEQAIARAFHALEVPVVARLHGAVVGGGLVLALLADVRVAADDATFELPELRVGAAIGFGGLFHLPRLVGLARAFELLYLTDRFDAATALRLGLVTRVVPAAGLDAATADVAARLAELAQPDAGGIRRALYRAAGGDLETALAAEGAAATHAWASGARSAAMARARAALAARRARR